MARLHKKPTARGPLVERVLQDGTIMIGRIAGADPTKEPAVTASRITALSAEVGPIRGRVVKRNLPDGNIIYGRIAFKK